MKQSIKLFICLISFLTVYSSDVSAFNFIKSGEIKLNNYSATKYLAYHLSQGAFLISSKIAMVTGSEYLKLNIEDTYSNASVVDLYLQPGKDNIVRFLTSHYDKYGKPHEGHCAFVFSNITCDKADFKVIEDSTYYGCGYDVSTEYIGINFNGKSGW